MGDGSAVLLDVLRAVCRELPAKEAYLGELDAAIGDGDHGITITRCCRIVDARLDACESLPVPAILEAIGTAVIDGGGGATGPLLGGALIAAGRAPAGAGPLTEVSIPTLLEAGMRAVEATGHARVGDKTVLDALAPAVEAARRTAEEGAGAAAIVRAAADAAAAGADATAAMRGGAGKAGRWGDAAVGHPDPGAVSLAIMLRVAAARLEETAR